MRILIVALLMSSAVGHATQSGTYTVDRNGWVVYDRDMKQDDLKVEVEVGTFSSKGIFDNLKGWFE